MRRLIAKVLTFQAKRLLDVVKPEVIVVSGSVGKTSTTQAIATVMSSKYKVRSTIANYNTDLGVPCSLFQQKFPSKLSSIFSWLRIFINNEIIISKEKKSKTFDLAVLELGSDRIGELSQFNWLKPKIAVVTAITAEHMDSFKTIQAVAKEELSVANYSNKSLLNRNLIDDKFLNEISSEYEWYSREHFNQKYSGAELSVNGEHSVDAIAAATAVAENMGLTKEEIMNSIKSVKPQPGRMNVLKGKNNSILIDDTYNASPEAMFAAIDYLYSCNTPKKVALLGNMNELGDSSAEEHTRVGNYCNPNEIQLVVTLGPDANKFTAEAARSKGCKVIETQTPYEAAEVIHKYINDWKNKTTILAKGSQNNVFAEEAVKLLLDNPSDSNKLVRQSDFWLKKKKLAFGVKE